MTDFTVRVELRGASWEDYENLHKRMQEHGYVRYVIGSDGLKYHLPDAEYSAQKQAGIYDVRDEVIRIAKLINYDPKVLVSETTARAWLLEKE